MWFRSYIYPITLPEYVMFMTLLNEDAQRIIQASGRMEFGYHWTIDQLPTTIAAYHDDNVLVALEEGPPKENRAEPEPTYKKM